ncbi:glycosyltransferase family 4 protein [Alteromonas australica]|uniref:glycosyltransferase family 4 protein n=1 Tax=Alteromonas australica TaxID=589873 RepID=UPI00235401B2|nr:glycosyltransferase family 4 protein [Alteromonas australica]|tara:strand:+ start:6245 stop:7396 length:1152 start_codon:yes stop_codon:yes gene_type:complete
MEVIQATIGRFHHFHLARQLEKSGLLGKIYTGYPKFKLKDEQGIPAKKIVSFPWIHAPYMARSKFGLNKYENLDDKWRLLDKVTFDRYILSKLKEPSVLVALSGTAKNAGRANQQLGGTWICDRGSSHIEFQNDLLRDEHAIWGVRFRENSTEIMSRECVEYECADYITVPSQFVYNSFVEKGIPENKLIKIPYGANLARFSKTKEPESNSFSVLWVGMASIRKGFFYALEAFQNLKCKNKKFTVIGTIEEAVKSRLKNYDLTRVEFKGVVANQQLKDYYSSHHVFVLPSIEEGLAMVQGEALACGCPVIATPNAGSEDLFEHSNEGFRVPIRNSQAILEAFEALLDQPELRNDMSEKALKKVQSLGGWDTYGEQFTKFLSQL